MSTRCFWLSPVDVAQRSLRRYKSSQPGETHYCSASVVIDEQIPFAAGVRRRKDGTEYKITGYGLLPGDESDISKLDPRWPAACASCGRAFEDGDAWQVNVDGLYAGAPDGRLRTLRDAPPGAMWDADWWSEKGPDGRALYVRLPNGRDWHVDGRASNCTRPGEEHYCWVRAGVPPDVTVGKGAPGESCDAGEGSILAGNYHGFLRAGVLVDA